MGLARVTGSPTDQTFERLKARYEQTGRSVPIRFRRVACGMAGPPSGPHLLHPYPAKLLHQIPRFFLSVNALSKPDGLVLDPFCGTGTVLLEALIADRRAVGADSNPLARLVTRAKTTRLDRESLRRDCELIRERLAELDRETDIPDVVNRSYWFYPHVTRELGRLSSILLSLREGPTRDFLLMCFSDCVRKVSLADLRVSVPVRLSLRRYPKRHWLHDSARKRIEWLRHVNVAKLFFSVVSSNGDRLSTLSVHRPAGRDRIEALYEDARDLSSGGHEGACRQPDESVDLVITSPPYAGAQKYIRASSLSLGWLRFAGGQDLRAAERKSIGREHYGRAEYEKYSPTGVAEADTVLARLHKAKPLRAHIMSTYLQEMRDALRETARVVKPRGHLVLIIGENKVCGVRFRTPDVLTRVTKGLGFSVVLELTDTIRARGLMTKRHSSAGLIPREHVVVFQKV